MLKKLHVLMYRVYADSLKRISEKIVKGDNSVQTAANRAWLAERLISINARKVKDESKHDRDVLGRSARRIR